MSMLRCIVWRHLFFQHSTHCSASTTQTFSLLLLMYLVVASPAELVHVIIMINLTCQLRSHVLLHVFMASVAVLLSRVARVWRSPVATSVLISLPTTKSWLLVPFPLLLIVSRCPHQHQQQTCFRCFLLRSRPSIRRPLLSFPVLFCHPRLLALMLWVLTHSTSPSFDA